MPSVRSLTIAGVNSACGVPAAMCGRKRENHDANTAGGSTRRMHSASISADDRKSSLAGSQAWQSASVAYQRDAASRSTPASSVLPARSA